LLQDAMVDAAQGASGELPSADCQLLIYGSNCQSITH
jgi:hypothetical protein